jgi:hypothetical protein
MMNEDAITIEEVGKAGSSSKYLCECKSGLFKMNEDATHCATERAPVAAPAPAPTPGDPDDYYPGAPTLAPEEEEETATKTTVVTGDPALDNMAHMTLPLKPDEPIPVNAAASAVALDSGEAGAYYDYGDTTSALSLKAVEGGEQVAVEAGTASLRTSAGGDGTHRAQEGDWAVVGAVVGAAVVAVLAAVALVVRARKRANLSSGGASPVATPMPGSAGQSETL